MAKKSEKKLKPDNLRKQAEKKLRQLTPKSIHALSASDSHKLIHELQVHQIELDMQNEELRRTQVELEESRSMYSDLYDFAPVGYLTTDKKGLIKQINITATGQLEKERKNLIGKPFQLFVHKDFQDIFYKHQHEIFKKKTMGTCEIRIKKKNGSEFFAQLVSEALAGTKGKPALLRTAMINITERKQAEHLLIKSEARYRMLADNFLVGITITTVNGTFVYANEALADMLDCESAREVMSYRAGSFYKDPEAGEDIIRRLKKYGKVNNCEVDVITKKGKTITVIFSATLQGDTITGMIMNITERKIMEQKLINARSQLEERVRERTAGLKEANEALSAEIHERERIATELQEKNIALKVLLQQRYDDRADMEQNIMSNINSLVQPYLNKLKNSKALKDELAYLNIIESNLNEIVSPFSNTLSSAYINFSPREIQVANLIKVGRQDKDIMYILNISFETVKTHRQNIRKKLGIYGKNTNLKTRLRAIID